MPGTKRGRNNNGGGNANPRPAQRRRNINSNANTGIAIRRRLGLNRAVLRHRVYQSLLQHYRNMQYANIMNAVNRALTRARI
jgi:hypothetical protein